MADMLKPDDLLTIPRAAEWIGVSRQSLFKTLKDGRVPSVEIRDHYGKTVRMVRRHDLDVYVATRSWAYSTPPEHYRSTLSAREIDTVREQTGWTKPSERATVTA